MASLPKTCRTISAGVGHSKHLGRELLQPRSSSGQWVWDHINSKRHKSHKVTSIAAPLALFLTFMDGEGGAEGYAAAVTRDQARILFDTAREMARRSPDLWS